MNTLTKMIDFSITNLTHNDSSQTAEITSINESAMYEVIENETLDNGYLEDMTISGSLFSLTTFNAVSFQSCAFFGSKIENCTFRNCTFTDCSFEFSNISHCKFIGCTFKNTKWATNTLRKNNFHFCSLDAKTLYFISKEQNQLWECFNNETINWKEALRMDSLSTICDLEDEHEVVEDQPSHTILDRLKKIAA